MQSAKLHFSDVRLQLSSDVDGLFDALHRVWGLARTPLRPPRRDHRVDIMARGSRIDVLVDGVAVESTTRPEDALPLAERALYHQIRTWHTQAQLLHGSCFVLDGRAFVLLGESGSGKSGLCWEAIRAGARYLTDELTVTDGRSVWGIPRAIQFDPIEVGAAVPGWLHGTDVATYRVRDPDGVLCAVPLVPIATTPLQPTPVDAPDVVVVSLHRGQQDAVEPLGVLETLAAIHAAAVTRPGFDVAGLLHERHHLRLQWATPAGGLAVLRRATREC